MTEQLDGGRIEASHAEAPVLGGARTLGTRVETLTGGEPAGFADGALAIARFNQPWGIAVDAAGNLFVADLGNHRIRKISPEGQVTTLAGDGTKGHVDGEAASARFSSPRAVAVDLAGNVYVADTDNNRIRKITAQGLVSTLSGEGTYGFLDGPRATARFAHPNGIAVDAEGWCYVADAGNSRIRKISPGGTATTLAGAGRSGYADAWGKEARFSSPRGLAIDAAGELYVAEVGNSRIRKVSVHGVVSTYAGDGRGAHVDGNARIASFYDPCGVAVDQAGNVYVADLDNHCIRMIAVDGEVTTVASNGYPMADHIDGLGSKARFNTPHGVCVGLHHELYVADTMNHCIRKVVWT